MPKKSATPSKKVKASKEAPPVSPTVSVTTSATSTRTEAERIWEEIRNLPIAMFGLPNQVVSQHCTFVPVDPSKLFVTIRSTATLPSLETAVGDRFVVELADKFVIVSRAPLPLISGKR